MSFFTFLLRSLHYDRTMHLLTVAAAALATAVLTGALLLGDSLRGSLRDLTLRRLGPVDTALVTDGFFREELLGTEPLPEPFTGTVPTILLPAALVRDDGLAVGGIQLVANRWSDGRFAVNGLLAERLGLEQEGGGRFLLRVEQPSAIPRDSVLGHRDETLMQAPVRIDAVLLDEDFARFSTRPEQIATPTLFVPLEWLQNRLDLTGKVNMLLVETSNSRTPSTPEQRKALQKRVHADLDALGVTVDVKMAEGAKDGDLWHLKSARMLFDEKSENFLQGVLGGTNVFPYLLALAETIRRDGREVPYAVLCAIDRDIEGLRPGEDEILLNDWAAGDLGIAVGDIVEVVYFATESRAGHLDCRSANLTVAGIVPMRGLAADELLVPEWPGITDELSISSWNPPFPFDAKKIRDRDEKYWDDYRATPKGFVSLATGRKLWAGRFGATSGFLADTQTFSTTLKNDAKILPKSSAETVQDAPDSPPLQEVREELAQVLASPDSPLAPRLLPLKSRGLAASAGTTPFNVLFLMMSVFIIAASLMLVALMFLLSVENRAVRIGTLLAVGWEPRRLRNLLLCEGLLLSLAGAVLGLPLGIAYGALLVHALNAWWVEAIVVPFLRLHVGPLSLLIGAFSGGVAAFLVIRLSLVRLERAPIRALLSGVVETVPGGDKERARPHYAYAWARGLVFYCFLALLMGVFMLLGIRQDDEMARAGFFFGAGALVLALGLFGLRLLFRRERQGCGNSKTVLSDFPRLAVSNIRRNPLRSLLCVGLVAQAVFLLLAVGAFRMNAATMALGKSSGAGGFFLVLETALPVFYDPGDAATFDLLPIETEDRTMLAARKMYSFAVRDGENAGCQNLYQATTPRILGVPASFVRRGGFAFSQTADIPKEKADEAEKTNGKPDNPWELLDVPQPDGAIPVILDAATAMYALHLYGGVGETFEIDGVRCRIVALLSNSLFQGDVLAGETPLRHAFPEVAGYRFFLAEDNADTETASPTVNSVGPVEGSPENRMKAIEAAYCRFLADFGIETERVRDRLARFFSVQNTYLACFQSLGAVGLLLGLFGLSIVQVRNVRQRRGELALFRVLGFSGGRLVAMILLETLFLLILGVLLGLLAAGVAVVPLLATPGETLKLLSTLLPVAGAILVVALFSNITAALTVLRIPVVAVLKEER